MSENFPALRGQGGPGAALKSLRGTMDLTLQEVSRRTGLAVSTLSKLENDRMSMSYDKLTAISDGLGVDIATLFGTERQASAEAAPVPTGRRSVQREGEGRVIETENYLHTYPAGDLLNKKFVPLIVDIKARDIDAFGPLVRHSGEEYTYVVEGAVELHTELYTPVLLNVGDSIYFDSSMGHAYIAAAPGTCRVVCICSHDDEAERRRQSGTLVAPIVTRAA